MVFPLLPNTPFTEGDAFSPELAYLAFNAPIFDDQTQFLGHRERITDAELSDSANALKARVQSIESSLQVSISSGLTLSYTSGTVRLPDGSQLTIASGLITVADNATSFVWVNPDGSVATGVTPPVSRLLLAKVVTVGGTVSTLSDLRAIAIRSVAPMAAAVKVFGGTNTTDETATQGKTYDQGVYFFRDFTVPAGISVTVSQSCKIFCSGTVRILGSVTVTAAAKGGAGYVSSAGNVSLGGVSGTGIGAGSGSGIGTSYPFTLQPYGSGGGTGFLNGTGVGSLGFGGTGGGAFWIESYGPVTIGSTGSITARGTVGSNGIVNTAPMEVSGAGGGSGGLVYLSSQSSVVCEAGSVIDVRGGNGGNGGSASHNGGGGGGGGFFVTIAPSVNLTGSTVLLAGGSAGTGTGSGLGAGCGGGFGGNGGGSTLSGSVGQSITRLYVPLGL